MSDNRKIALRAFSWPLLITLSTLLPGINLLLFGHAGIGFILLLGSLPWFVIQLLLGNQKVPSDRKKSFKRFVGLSLLTYFPLSFLLAMVGAYGILSTGLYGDDADFWQHMYLYWEGLFFPFLFYTLFRNLFPS
jgi:hypothetical protein